MERSRDEKVANQVRRISRDAMGMDRDAIRLGVATRWKNVATRKKVLTSTRDAKNNGRDAILVKNLGHAQTRAHRDAMKGGSRRDAPARTAKPALLNSKRPNTQNRSF